MKRAVYIIAASLLALALFFVVSAYFPKSVGRYPFFVVLFLLDLYLFLSVWEKIKALSKFFSAVATWLYWLPALLTGILIACLPVYPFDHWSKWIKIYVVGFIFIGYFSKLIPIFFLIADDFRRLIRKIISAKKPAGEKGGEKIPRSVFLQRLGLITGGIMFTTLLGGMVKWVSDFRVRRVRIPFPGLPVSFSGLKIVQFSDIHLGSWASKKDLDEAVALMNSLNPDVIFFTGDLVNYKTEEAFEYRESLAALRAPLGIYTILGNHDYGDYSPWPDHQAKKKNMELLYDFYDKLGWKLLLNENHILRIGGESLAIIGVENWGSFSRFQKYGDLKKSVAGAEDIAAKILLSHDPSHWEVQALNFPVHIGLTLSGHTHGAQFGFEFPGFRWSPSQYIYKYWSGLYSKQNKKTGNLQYLYVNRGIGTIGYPGRVGIWPEITFLELV
ncbi:MAG: metallophosphoesterase [Bacteroidetes bacterium]|nr:metallophosphoesterase [Bacteroidota bacterium]